MADAADPVGAEEEETDAKKKGGKGPLLIGLVLMLLLGGGAAYGVMSGLIPIPGDKPKAESAKDGDGKATGDAAEGKGGDYVKKASAKKKDDKPPVFVNFEPLTITLGGAKAPRQLRLTFTIETGEKHAKKIETEKPRILDALNTLLRAMDERDLADPRGLDRIRALMLRRIRIATDPTAIKDLLITEFVIF